VVVVSTPYDADLVTINRKLVETTLTFGAPTARAEADAKKETAYNLETSSAAPRAGVAGKSKKTAAYDLLDNIKEGKVQLEQLKKEELPKELQTLSRDQQRSYLKNLAKQRATLQSQAADLGQKRQDYILQKNREQGQGQQQVQDSFDNRVMEMLQIQARRANIHYETRQGKKK
jgi:hypothetical protein